MQLSRTPRIVFNDNELSNTEKYSLCKENTWFEHASRMLNERRLLQLPRLWILPYHFEIKASDLLCSIQNNAATEAVILQCIRSTVHAKCLFILCTVNSFFSMYSFQCQSLTHPLILPQAGTWLKFADENDFFAIKDHVVIYCTSYWQSLQNDVTVVQLKRPTSNHSIRTSCMSRPPLGSYRLVANRLTWRPAVKSTSDGIRSLLWKKEGIPDNLSVSNRYGIVLQVLQCKFYFNVAVSISTSSMCGHWMDATNRIEHVS